MTRAREAAARLAAGSRLGPYEIVSLIGAGGMGEVYRAHDPRLGRDVAIKVLPATAADEPERLRRFEQEARAAGVLNHPNVLAVFDVGMHQDAPYVVSELLEGETLRKRIREGPLPPRKALDCAVQAAAGLAAAHEKGIVHRDLKPENLFITRDGRVKILDFGLAKLLRSPSEDDGTVSFPEAATARGRVLGTVGYMSPEQVRGEPVDARSDIFSLGAVLYETLSGQRAFRGATSAETLVAILKEDPPQPPAAVPAVLDRIVRRCLEKRPEERFQSARDVGFALEAISVSSSPIAPFVQPRRVPRLWTGAVALTLAGGLAAGLLVGRAWEKPQPSFRQLTYRRGTVWSARFAPDGHTVAYGAAWEGAPIRVFTSREGSPESTPLPVPDANLLAISASGEMALSLGHRPGVGLGTGTLARMPLAGGAPRELLEDVQYADWTPDASGLAVVRAGRPNRLECPIGTILYEAKTGWISHPRVSPAGDRVAFVHHPAPDDAGSVESMDFKGRRTTLSNGWMSVQGLAWHRSGEEIWFTAAREGSNRSLWAVSLSGKERLIERQPATLTLHDISRDGRVLIARDSVRTGTIGLGPGQTRERDLSWLDFGVVSDLSADGAAVLFTETGEGAGSRYAVYLRKMDGSPAVRLGEGFAAHFSPDGKWALTLVRSPDRLVLLPTGAGEARSLQRHGIETYRAHRWFPDASKILFTGTERGHAQRVYVQDLAGGKPHPITPDDVPTPVELRDPISPDGRWVTVVRDDRRLQLYPIDEGDPADLGALRPEDRLIGWASYGRVLHVLRHQPLPARVYRWDVGSGERRLLMEIIPPDPAGVSHILWFRLTSDARSYAYSYVRHLSELYEAEGLK